MVAAESSDDVLFPGALTYSKVGAFKDRKDVTLQEVHGAAGFELSEHISFGTAVKYLIMEGKDLTQVTAYNSTVGLLISPHRDLGIAFVYDDFFDSKDIPTSSTLGLGAQYIFR